ncbi:MAG: PKD domain-containing protein [Crocinitomicaceae bacterium]|nr:PKD domain-containing protein [Crocinitomicaceae bacterium]
MNRLLILTTVLLLSSISYGQEICDNGVDDDADGLIDMNDPDCACNGLGGSGQSVTSLIPNPSFENNSCCPSGVSQLYCADNWIQASNATSDYFNTCGYTGIFNSPDLPLPGSAGGAGYGGFYSNPNWEENIGACLNSPMTAGTSYTMDLWTAWSTGSQTLQLTLYGTPNCGDLPWNTSNCAVGSGSWMVLGSVTVNYAPNQSWQQVQITFTPPVDINAVSLGGPCGGQTSGTNYYFIDELTLASTASFQPGLITESGNWCTNDLALTASLDTVGGSWQWYENGIALAGETDSVLNAMPYGPGDYTAVYTLGTECESSDYTLTVPGAPTANFTFTNQCDGNAVTFTDASTVIAPAIITNYDWDFGDGNTSTTQSPSHTYASDGTYNVSLTVTDDNGCQNTMTQAVTVYPNPVNDIEFVINGVSSATGLTGGCLVDQVNFVNNTTINAPDNITTWNWDFGDGNTSTAQNPPAHTYAAAGNYTIQLTTTSNNGCTDNVTLPITIFPSPVAAFTVPDDCISQPAAFTNNSSISSGTITTYEWDFGDGNTSGVQNPTHNYASSGNYNLQLVVISDQGCTDTATGATTRFPEPVADFTMTSECIVVASTIVNNSSVPAPDNITTWFWDFDDGNTSTVQNPGSHAYAVENTYNVMLAVETNNGCQDTMYLPVTVNPSPVASFTITDECLGVPANFNNTSSISSGSISNYDWDFGDGNTSTQQSPTHNYNSDGTYTVELIVTSNLGCPDTVTGTTTRHPIPVPNFTVNDVCVYDPITVTENVTINAPDNIASWDWDLGDGNTGTGATANHTYATYGTYNIEMTATSNNGCTADTTISVNIHAQPVPNFTSTTVCENLPPTVFTESSNVPGGSIASWQWDFGDGNTGTGAGISHSYSNFGVYNAELLVTSAFGCVDSITQPVTVYEVPNVSFMSDLNAICSPDTIVFTDNSTTPSVSLTNWQWNFYGGLGSTSGAQSTVNYINSGSVPVDYDVQLIVTNSVGCKDTVLYTDYITVYPTPDAQFTTNPNSLNILETEIDFINTSVNSDEWEWNFGDGTPISMVENPTHLYPTEIATEYEVELIAYNYGRMCSDTITKIVVVEDVIIFHVPNIFTPDGDEFNETWKPIFYSGHDPFDFHLIIFNRWGEIIWESFNPDVAWDGHYGDGGLVEDGVYIWTLEFSETMSDKRHSYNGHVTVLK